jgi:hypothetical protein
MPPLLHGNVLEDSRRALLENTLRERKIPFETRSLFTGFGGFGSSIHVLLPASPAAGEKKSGSFILALPLSFTGDDGRELPYAFEAALGFIDRARGEGLPIDAMVAFLGDEWSELPVDRNAPYLGHQAPHLGLMDLLSRLELPEDAAMIYLDLYGARGELVIHHGARRTLAPLNILMPLVRFCGEEDIAYTLAVNANELYKLGLADGPSALEFALGRELPALCLTGGASPAGDLQNLDALLFDYARSVEPGTENPDYHYLVFQALGRFFFVSEYATALLFLAAAALFFFAALIYSVALRYRLTVQWEIFLKRSWILLLYWLMLVLALKGAALLFRVVSRGTDPALLGESALLFYVAAVLQLVAGVSLFMVFSFLGNCIHVPQRENFYGSSAVILVIVEILLAAYIDITFIPMFIWAFVFTFLAACIRKPALIRLCVLLAFFQGSAALSTLVRTGNRRLGFLIFSGNTAFILYVALVSLPFLITLKRGALLAARRAGKQKTPGELRKELTSPKALIKRLAPRLILFASAAALGIGVYFFARNPIDPAGGMTVVNESDSGGILAMSVLDRTFLERRILNITLKAPPNPLRFNLFVEGVQGGEIPLIYSAPMPFRYIEDPFSQDRSFVEFILGEGPPNPFSTEIALPIDFAGFLRAEALYVEGKDDYQIRIIRRYPLGLIDVNNHRSGEASPSLQPALRSVCPRLKACPHLPPFGLPLPPLRGDPRNAPLRSPLLRSGGNTAGGKGRDKQHSASAMGNRQQVLLHPPARSPQIISAPPGQP